MNNNPIRVDNSASSGSVCGWRRFPIIPEEVLFFLINASAFSPPQVKLVVVRTNPKHRLLFQSALRVLFIEKKRCGMV